MKLFDDANLRRSTLDVMRQRSVVLASQLTHFLTPLASLLTSVTSSFSMTSLLSVTFSAACNVVFSESYI